VAGVAEATASAANKAAAKTSKPVEEAAGAIGDLVEQAVGQAAKVMEQLATATTTAVKQGKAAAKSAETKVSATRQRVDELTRQMFEVASLTVKQGESVMQRLQALRAKASEKLAAKLEGLESRLTDALTVTRRVLDQTAQRLAGVASIPNRLVSIFDRDARPIRRGKLSQPIEFGYKVRIDEVEHGVVSGYDVFVGNPSDTAQAAPALEHHEQIFGRAPHAVATDMGYSSAENEQAVKKRGVKHVCMPARGKLDAKRKKVQDSSWFRRLQKWRTGCEATISRLKRQYQMDTSYLSGLEGTGTWVGFSVFTHNLGRIKGLKAAKSTRAAERAARKKPQGGANVEVMARG
jgi:IS5 family transposase